MRSCTTLPLFLILSACSAKMPQMMSPSGEPLAAGLGISEVSIYQGPKSVLMKDGELTERDVPVVQGRDALLRIYFSVERATWTARQLLVRVERSAGGVALAPLEKTLRVSGTSVESNLESTASFEVGAAEMVA